MKRTSITLLLVALLAFCGVAAAQSGPGTQTVLVLPFENKSKAPGLDWISEAFPEIIGQRLSSTAGLYVIGRDDRLYAFDRLGIPSTLHASRATLYRIAEQMDADWVILGSYNYDGKTFSADAQMLDMKGLHLSAPFVSSGPLSDLIEVQTGMAYDMMKTLRPYNPATREEFLRTSQSIRIDAFENYIRGITASTRQEKMRRFREAVRLNPQYTLAMLQLGRTYYAAREYDQAANWLSRIPVNDPASGEANFLLGICDYSLGQFERAESAFKTTAARIPLTEVYNNLGVVASRRGKREAFDYFERAVHADPNDPDYRFNLAVTLAKMGENTLATRSLRETLAQNPTDSEARQFLEALNSQQPATQSLGSTNTPPASQASLHIPLPRLKRNYDESSYRQLALEVENAVEQSLAKASPATRANYHAEHGHELLMSGQNDAAEKEFRQAISYDYNNVVGHAGLARIAELRKQNYIARNEALMSMRIKPNVDALLVLTRLDLSENHLTQAAKQLQDAIALDPSNPGIAPVKRDLEERQAAGPALR